MLAVRGYATEMLAPAGYDKQDHTGRAHAEVSIRQAGELDAVLAQAADVARKAG